MSAQEIKNMIVGVGSVIPDFSLEMVKGNDQVFSRITNVDLRGKWSVLFTWPFDFTFVCPTEVLEFNRLYEDFAKLNCTLLGMSIDSPYVHMKWRSELGEIHFPFLSDVRRDLSNALGILDATTGATYRATYIIDPDLVIKSISVNDLSVGRNPKEVLRLLQAFQTGKLCGCNWEPGQTTLN